MPTRAQDRTGRGPFAALLILLSLFLGPAASAAGADLNNSAPRLGSSRQGPSAALLPAGTRNPFDDERPDSDSGPLPAAPRLVTERLWTRPPAGYPSAGQAATPRPATTSYRARAPPAS